MSLAGASCSNPVLFNLDTSSGSNLTDIDLCGSPSTITFNGNTSDYRTGILSNAFRGRTYVIRIGRSSSSRFITVTTSAVTDGTTFE